MMTTGFGGPSNANAIDRKAQQAITELIQSETTKARIDELQKLYVDHDDRKLRHIEGSKLIPIPDRIAALQNQSTDGGSV